MLHRDPKKRPNVKKILEKDFLAERITSLLSNTVAKHEFRSLSSKNNGLPSLEKEQNNVSIKTIERTTEKTNSSEIKKNTNGSSRP